MAHGPSTANLLRTRRFSPLFWTQFLGAFNDNLLKNAMVILIAFRSAQVLGLPPGQMVALAGGIFILPFFLFSATSGQLADKLEKTRLIRLIKLAEIAIMGMATAGFLFERYGFLLFVLFLMGLHSTFFGPIKYGILPQLLATPELLAGNALIEGGTFLAILLGTITGGVVVSSGPRGPLAVSALLLGVALAGYAACRLIPRAPPTDPGSEVRLNPLPPMAEIYRFIRGNRQVFFSVLAISWFWFYGAAILALIPLYCKDVLHANERVVTLFLALFSIGIGLGSVICGKLSGRRLELGFVPLGALGMTLFLADLRWARLSGAEGAAGIAGFLARPGGARIALDLLLLSVFSGFYTVPLYTLMQERAEPECRSRVIAGNNIVNAALMVASTVMLMALQAAGLGAARIFLVVALLNAGVAVWIYHRMPEIAWRFVIAALARTAYRLRAEGLERIPETGPAILVCNHQGFADWLFIMASVGRPVRFVIDHAFARGWMGRALISQVGVIPIAPAAESFGRLRSALRGIGKALSQGELVVIFPEGEITRSGKLGRFHRGVEGIVAATPVPVIPMALGGVWGSVFSRKGGRAVLKLPRRFRARIRLIVGEPMAPDRIDAGALHERVSALAADANRGCGADT